MVINVQTHENGGRMTIDLLLLNKEISYSGNELDKNDIPPL